MKWVRLGYCPKCGKDVDADYCDECGAYTQEPAEEEESCQSTPTNAPKGTAGMSTEHQRRVRKYQKDAVRRARKAKQSTREAVERSPRQ